MFDLLFSPFVLATDLIFLIRGEVILNVKGLADLLGGFALDHVRHSLATDVEKSFDVKIVCSLDMSSAAEYRPSHPTQPTKMISNNISWSTCMNF